MSFTITGQATDLDLDVASLPTVTAQVLAPWTAEDGALRTSHATGRFDETGALVKDDGGPWVIGAPEAAPMYVKVPGLPPLRFPAPADRTTVDLADLYAKHSPLPAPSPTTAYVRGASAYEVAVAEGFVGTEAEWLATLEGEDGEPGVDGTAAPHASTHATDGSDPITPASIEAQPTIPDTGWLDITELIPLPGVWSGQLLIRRVGDLVHLALNDLRSDTERSTGLQALVDNSALSVGFAAAAQRHHFRASRTTSLNDRWELFVWASQGALMVDAHKIWGAGVGLSGSTVYPTRGGFPSEPYPGAPA